MNYSEIITTEEIEPLETASFSGPIIIVSEPGQIFNEAVKHLNDQRFIGFDTETKPVFQANCTRSKTALLQLSSETKSYLFRLHELGLPQEITDILANKYITKIGAAVHDDIRGLQKYRYFTPGRFIDLQQIAENYGIKEKSVRKLAAIILKTKVSKSQQLSNWEAEELSDAQQKYAATDAWVCLVMYKKLLASPKKERQPEQNYNI